MTLSTLLPSGMALDAVKARIDAELTKRDRQNLIRTYKPYARQLEFHDAGKRYRERLFRAGNQLGKTFAGSVEATFHLTGDYPQWWQGRRFEQPVMAWIGGPSQRAVREGPQRLLAGPLTDLGTGVIPRKLLLDTTPARGLPETIDTLSVRHVTGGVSMARFMSYEQGRQKWQVATLDFLWLDEEPPEDIYMEALSRTNATGGMVYMTFTPLLGVSNVVMRFLKEKSPDRHDTVMTIEDAEHIPPERRAQIIASYPEHEREARTRGVPILGSGRIFPFPRRMLSVEPFPIPRHWAILGGMDFGWNHPFAAVKLAHNRDEDIVYVVNAYREREATPVIHCASLKPWGAFPWAWPHDGLNHEKGSGEELANIYSRNGLEMMIERAQFEDDRGNGVEAGIMSMLDRMQTNRLKVFANLGDWFEEFELYHRKDGKVVKMRDDLLDATRTGLMMLRYAAAGPEERTRYGYSGNKPKRTWRTV